MYERYPDPHCRALRAAIAEHESSGGVDIKNDSIVCGNGASDLIYRLCLAKKPKNVLVCRPSFSDYERAARLCGAKLRHHILFEEEDFRLTERIFCDIDNIDMVFLCNPNNPDGNVIDCDLLFRLGDYCAKHNILLVLDECFLPFVDEGANTESIVSHLSKHIVVLKAFTKTFSLAGLRVGYMICGDKDLLEAVYNFGQCWSVSVPAQIAALAALDCGQWFLESKSIIKKERLILTEKLRDFGFKVYNGNANYILFRCGLSGLGDKLMEKNILIRTYSQWRDPPFYFYRICVRNKKDNEILIAAIKEILKVLEGENGENENKRI
jgi:threonine-phosphate decarboxylase